MGCVQAIAGTQLLVGIGRNIQAHTRFQARIC